MPLWVRQATLCVGGGCRLGRSSSGGKAVKDPAGSTRMTSDVGGQGGGALAWFLQTLGLVLSALNSLCDE